MTKPQKSSAKSTGVWLVTLSDKERQLVHLQSEFICLDRQNRYLDNEIRRLKEQLNTVAVQMKNVREQIAMTQAALNKERAIKDETNGHIEHLTPN